MRRRLAWASREAPEIENSKVLAAHRRLERPDRVSLIIGHVALLAAASETKLGAPQTAEEDLFASGDDDARQFCIPT